MKSSPVEVVVEDVPWYIGNRVVTNSGESKYVLVIYNKLRGTRRTHQLPESERYPIEAAAMLKAKAFCIGRGCSNRFLYRYRVHRLHAMCNGVNAL